MEANANFCWTKPAMAISNYAEKWKRSSLRTQGHAAAFKERSILESMILHSH
jgi:hypothetical protein